MATTKPPAITPNLKLKTGLKSSGYENVHNFRLIDAAVGAPVPVPLADDAAATAMLTAGTDTTPRMWSAKQLTAFFTKKP
jgi:hypothetical protein